MAWCGNHHLTLNMNKIKEVIVDFRRNRDKSKIVSIKGEEVEVVEEYRYLGVHLDNRLEWRINSEAVYKKRQSRLYFLRKLRSVKVCSIRARDLKRLNLIKKAGFVLGTTVK